MSYNYNAVSDHLVRGEIWSDQLKERLEESLLGQRYVKWLDFTDGTTFTIPSIGGAVVRDYQEDTPIVYDKMDTGEFQFSGFDYVSSATYITDKAKMDSHYTAQLVSRFVPEQQLAIEKKLETDVLAVMDGGQTANDNNLINGAHHRWVGTTTVGANADCLGVADYARAKYALMQANVPLTNLIAIVHPSVAFHMETQSALTSLAQTQPAWERVVNEGILTGMNFAFNLYGFDTYISNFVPSPSSIENSLSIGGASASTSHVKNFFFSAAGDDLLNVVGAWRQMPRVESERNKDMQRDEYVTTARYGLKGGYRPENIVTVLTNPSTV